MDIIFLSYPVLSISFLCEMKVIVMYLSKPATELSPLEISITIPIFNIQNAGNTRLVREESEF